MHVLFDLVDAFMSFCGTVLVVYVIGVELEALEAPFNLS